MDDINARKMRHRDLSCRKRLLRKEKSLDSVISSSPKANQGLVAAPPSTSPLTPRYAASITSISKHPDTSPVSGSSSDIPRFLRHSSSATTNNPLCNEPGADFESPPTSPKRPIADILSERPTLQLEMRAFKRKRLTSDDDDINAVVDSPDSGFESATPSTSSLGVDYFDESSKSEPLERNLSRTSSMSCDPLEDNRLCLLPPSKPEPPPPKKDPTYDCKWQDCGIIFSAKGDLHSHLQSAHVHSNKRICCLWLGCKYNGVEAKKMSWLQQHIQLHSGDKRFKCMVGGCEASFNSRPGLKRHVDSHFRDNLPKAKISSHAERKYLVKRRKIKDEKKPLANTHDFIDDNTVLRMVGALVEQQKSSLTSQDVVCTRSCGNGSSWLLRNSISSWVKTSDEKTFENPFFFRTKTKRCRKFKSSF